MTSRTARVLAPRAPQEDATQPHGYRLADDLVIAYDDDDKRWGAVEWFAPDRAAVMRDDPFRDPPLRGTLVFPETSALGPVRVRLLDDSGDDPIARVEIVGTSLALARLQLAWVRERVRRGDAFAPATTELVREPIRDPERIARILAMLRGTSAAVTVKSSRGPIVRGRIDREGALLLEWDRAVPIEPPLRVRACGYNSVYEMQWPDTAAFAAPPPEIVRIRRRVHRRVAAPARLRVSFRHPIWPGLQAEREVLDVSRDGLAFCTDAANDGIFPGLTLPVTVHWKRGLDLTFIATVRHCTTPDRARSRGCRHACGLSIRATDEPTAARWDAEIETLLHPISEKSPAVAEQWALFEKTGYFRLSGKSNAAFAPLRRDFEAQRLRLAAHPEIGAHFGVRSGRRLQAVISQIQAWSGGWLVSHFARQTSARPLAAAGDDVLRELFVHAYEHVQHREHARFVVSFVQEVARFSRRSQLELGAKLADEGLASVTPFRAIEMRCNAVFGLQPPPGVVVTRADRVERELVARWLAHHRPAHYLQATGLDGRRLELGEIVARWRRAGLRRTRQVIVVRDRDATEAALILDGADPGLHLFGLLDVARFVPLSGRARGYLPLLLQNAARWFGAAGKRSFVYFEEYAPLDRVAHPGAVDLGLAYCVALPVAALPEQLEHVYEITAPPTSGTL